jgi:hypothetical protein
MLFCFGPPSAQAQARLCQPLADPELGCCVTDPRATGPGLAHTSKTRLWTIECKTLYRGSGCPLGGDKQ